MGFPTFPSHRETTNTPARSIQEQGQVSGPGKTHILASSGVASVERLGLIRRDLVLSENFMWKPQIPAFIAGDPIFRHTHLVKIIWVCLNIGDPQIWCVIIIIFTMFNDQKLSHHQATKDFSRTRSNPMSGGIESREPTFSTPWFLVISFFVIWAMFMNFMLSPSSSSSSSSSSSHHWVCYFVRPPYCADECDMSHGQLTWDIDGVWSSQHHEWDLL